MRGREVRHRRSVSPMKAGKMLWFADLCQRLWIRRVQVRALEGQLGARQPLRWCRAFAVPPVLTACEATTYLIGWLNQLTDVVRDSGDLTSRDLAVLAGTVSTEHDRSAEPVLRAPMAPADGVVRAKRPERLPEVLTP